MAQSFSFKLCDSLRLRKRKAARRSLDDLVIHCNAKAQHDGDHRGQSCNENGVLSNSDCTKKETLVIEKPTSETVNESDSSFSITSGTTLDRMTLKYRRFCAFFSRTHDIPSAHSSATSSSTFSVPSAISAFDFSLIATINSAPQHHYPTQDLLSGSQILNPKRHFTAPRLRRERQARSEFKNAYKRLRPTPDSLSTLLNLPREKLPCTEYFSVYIPLISSLSVHAQRLRKIAKELEYEYFCDMRVQYSSSVKSPQNVLGYVDSVYPSEDEEEYFWPRFSQSNEPYRLNRSEFDIAVGEFAPVAPLRFIGGCRTFGDYLREFGLSLARRSTPSSYELCEIAINDLETMMRSKCPAVLLRSMAITEGLSKNYYLTSKTVNRSKFSWNRKAYNKGLSSKDKELIRGMASYTADRNYIWKRRAENLLYPDFVILEDPDECVYVPHVNTRSQLSKSSENELYTSSVNSDTESSVSSNHSHDSHELFDDMALYVNAIHQADFLDDNDALIVVASKELASEYHKQGVEVESTGPRSNTLSTGL
ncbi:hypothetical protein V1512DRAFT_260163 [Lipomyces arxii]|uniref:uncharacterized protein n=1 Tax=Lipomyces arxii TaxID=56418 RepID=UPI0034CD4762